MSWIGWIWRGVTLFIILTAVYVVLTITRRMKEKHRLKQAYAETDGVVDKETYMEAGMTKYNRSLKAKLVLGVYLIPLAIGAFLTYLAQNT